MPDRKLPSAALGEVADGRWALMCVICATFGAHLREPRA